MGTPNHPVVKIRQVSGFLNPSPYSGAWTYPDYRNNTARSLSCGDGQTYTSSIASDAQPGIGVRVGGP